MWTQELLKQYYRLTRAEKQKLLLSLVKYKERDKSLLSLKTLLSSTIIDIKEDSLDNIFSVFLGIIENWESLHHTQTIKSHEEMMKNIEKIYKVEQQEQWNIDKNLEKQLDNI